ncbi:tail fiber assembly protein [Photorhabdus namnaonensis]|uniref:Caudovirales tail fiber assembly protein n=1 Tax=Photorhabdus namnaonensis TaxID=1851568 RepID=A0A1B8YF99_9GAMM|nr:tail fiber assembly protein [Photorhabdus namnaonensis]OCA53740.1 Caudovirales tail fiber assembly protein [Photorhabdus namnaonensis]
MRYIYSPKSNSFYPVELKQRYMASDSWPEDGIEVSEKIYLEFASNSPPVGKRRIAGSDGLPAWGDIPPPSQKELQRSAERKKQHLMLQAANTIAPLQDAVDLEIATDKEQTTLTEWRKYRVLLSRVDCSIAPDIVWPEQPK